MPALIDTTHYDVSNSGKAQAVFSKKATLLNYSGTRFDIAIERKISLLDKKQVETRLNAAIPANLRLVGFETENTIQNTGNQDWSNDKGLLSIWLLGMFTHPLKRLLLFPSIHRRAAVP